MSNMGRLAYDIKERSIDEAENTKICKELSQFWQDGDLSKLSPKAKEIWDEWKKENEKQNGVNKEEINEWEGQH